MTKYNIMEIDNMKCQSHRVNGIRCNNKALNTGYCSLHNNKKYIKHENKQFNINIVGITGRIRSKKDIDNDNKYYEYLAR